MAITDIINHNVYSNATRKALKAEGRKQGMFRKALSKPRAVEPGFATA
jgi:hypothetical protein